MAFCFFFSPHLASGARRAFKENGNAGGKALRGRVINLAPRAMKDGSFWSALASRRVDPSRLLLEHLSLLPRQHMGWWRREGGGNMTLAKKK